MSQSDKANHWDALAEQMGIDVPAETAAQDPAEMPSTEAPTGEITPPEPEPEQAAVAEPAPLEAKQSGGGWASLAEELGVEQAPDPEPAVAPAIAASGEKEVAGEPIFVDVEVVDETLPIENAAQEAAATLSETVEENIDFGETVAKAEPSEEEEAAKAKRPARKRRRRSARKPRGEKTAESEKPEAAVEAPEAELGETVAANDEEEPTDGRRRRRRRRRRSGRKADAEGEHGESDMEDETTDEVDEEVSDQTEETMPKRSTRPSHKNIPTWEETVGIIVQSNMETRSARPKAAWEGEGRGQGRGRSRGRGRKK